MIEYIEQGDIVLVPFPYSNLKEKKIRPVVVISNHLLHQGADFIGVCVSRSETRFKPQISITAIDLLVGTIPQHSFIHFHKVHLLEKSLIEKVVGQVKPALLENIIVELEKFFLLIPPPPSLQ